MSVKMRQIIEREIGGAIVDELLKAGFEIQIDNTDPVMCWMTDRQIGIRTMGKGGRFWAVVLSYH